MLLIYQNNMGPVRYDKKPMFTKTSAIKNSDFEYNTTYSRKPYKLTKKKKPPSKADEAYLAELKYKRITDRTIPRIDNDKTT
jgi:hypothetical protein